MTILNSNELSTQQPQQKSFRDSLSNSPASNRGRDLRDTECRALKIKSRFGLILLALVASLGLTRVALSTCGRPKSNFLSVFPISNSDGASPYAGLILSGNTLYGTTFYGGTSGYGTVFAINTDGTGFTTLYSFTQGSDGCCPKAVLILSGNTLYGTAELGGSSGNGTVFAVNTDGTGFTTLHSFASSDGISPQARLILLGNTLYGTTTGGGSSFDGTVFALDTDGTGFRKLHNFTTGSDGADPSAGLIASTSGNTLYGTAVSLGGGGSAGTVFAVNTNGTGFTTLHSFTGSSDGANPGADLILSGNTLYGTASEGTTNGNGTVFSLSLAPVIRPQLSIIRSAPNVILSWPTNATGFVLQSATTLANGGDWQDTILSATETNGQKVVTLTPTGAHGFFRLNKP
jgi:uncharacterized repeat protein (TIGR03803 family)